MSNPEAQNAEVSSLLKNIYRCADKSSWYNSVAKAYDRTRPRYPEAIWAYLQEIAQLEPGKSVLEIGSGPGIATVELAKTGAKIVALEPSLSACELAKSKCAAYANVEVVNTTFEAWELNNQKFDVVVATTSFHWVSPEVRHQKAATALKDSGLLVLMWNTPPQPSYEVHQSLREVYLNHAPELAKYEGHQSHEHNLGLIGKQVLDSGYFCDLAVKKSISQVRYSVDDYLTLLSTLSPYIRLESEQRSLRNAVAHGGNPRRESGTSRNKFGVSSHKDRAASLLLSELQKVLQLNYDTYLELEYLSLVQIARVQA